MATFTHSRMGPSHVARTLIVGFIAGAIGSNPAKAEKLIASFFPVAPDDEWVIVRAIAYSGLPDWRNVLRRVAVRMPARRVMV